MQHGSLIRTKRQHGPDVWEFRWREPGPDGKRKHRRIVLGSVEQLVDEAAARQATAALDLDMNYGDPRIKARLTTVSQLVDHYRHRELEPDKLWKTHSTKVTYEGYLNKWILPRWGAYPLLRINAGEVELWLRSLPLARASCAKIRNLMSLLFNHGIRHEICQRNPIQLVRQSAKRKRIPVILSPGEVRRLLPALELRERTLVLLDFGTGLRMSELFALKWSDINFQKSEIRLLDPSCSRLWARARRKHLRSRFRSIRISLKHYGCGASIPLSKHRTIGCLPVRLLVAENRIGVNPSCEHSFDRPR
jgi:integrase